MTAKTTLADLQWLRSQIAALPADDPAQVARLRDWADTAISVRLAQITRSKTQAHDELMTAYWAAVEQWKQSCEQETNAFPSETAEYRATHPMPTLASFMRRARRSSADHCPLCGAPVDKAVAA